MKKTIALVLCLFLTVSLAACGSQSAAADESSASAEQTGKSSESVEIEPKPAFDTSWTGVEYEMPIPEPPFTQFSVEKNETASGTVEYFIMSKDAGEVNALTENNMEAYCESLQKAGFRQVKRKLEYSETSGVFEAYTDDNTGYVFVEHDTQSGTIVIVADQYSAEDAERIK